MQQQQQRQQRQRRTNAADSARAARLLATDLLGALSMLLVHTAICLRLGSAGEGSGGPSWVQALGPTAQTPATSPATSLLLQLRFPASTVLLPVVSMASAFALAWAVGPQLLQSAAGHAGPHVTPPQRLLSELPLRQQVLVAVLYTLLPMGFWYLQDTAAHLGMSVRPQRGGRVGASARRGDRRSTPQQEQEHTEKSQVQQNVSSLTAKPRRLQITQQRPGDNANTGDGVVGSGSTSWPASEATRVDQAHSSIGASPPPVTCQQIASCLPVKQLLISRPVATAGTATQHLRRTSDVGRVLSYRGRTSCAVLSIKVQSHPGSFERYSRRVLEAAPAIAAAAAASGESLLPTNDKRGGDSGTGAPYVGQAVVVRGCVQLIMWTHTPVAAADGAVSAPEQPQQPPMDARLLSQLLPDGDQVGGLAVQQQQQQQQQQAAVAAAAGGSVAVQLLHLTPPVLPLPGGPTASDATAPPPEPLRLRLFSPGPQRARLLVVGSSSTEAAAAATAAGGLRPQRVFAELQVQLCGGDQELELGGEVLRQLLLMACVEAEVPTGRGRALQLLLLPPVHDNDELVEAADGSSGEVMPPPPLLHFSAPLLVLPAAAAVELCGLWEQVAAEAGGDAAAAHAHLQPLLSDLAYVLEAAETEELPAAAEGAGGGTVSSHGTSVASALVTYLQRAGLTAACSMVAGLGSSGSSDSRTSQAPKAARNAVAAASPRAAAAEALSRPSTSRPAATALLHGFSPPQLEAQFAAWRAVRLARAAPFLLAMTAQPYLLGLIRAVAEQPRAVVVQTLLLVLALWLADILGSLVLLLRQRACARAARRASTQAQAPAPALADTALPTSLHHKFDRLYHVACVYIAPALFLAASIVSRLRPLPSNDVFVGNPRVLLGSAFSRGLVLPSVQQLSWRQAAAAAVLLAPGEALQAAALQPGWRWGWVVAMVVGWRLAACATSAAWEWRARARFLVLQERAQQEPRACEDTKKAKTA